MKMREIHIVKLTGLCILLLTFLVGTVFSGDEDRGSDRSEPAPRNLKRISPALATAVKEEVGSEPILPLDTEFEIRLRSRRLTPPEDIEGLIKSHVRPSKYGRVHVIMQFHDIPNVSERGILKGAGVKLLHYIPNKAWFVSVPRGIAQAQLANARVRWIGSILPEDKIFPAILNRGVAAWAVNDDGSVNLEVSIFKDVSLNYARDLMARMGATVKEESPVSNRLTVMISPDKIMDIAGEDMVRWIIEERPPKKRLNDGARANVGANAVQGTPYNLDGSGVDVGIWDGGEVDTTHDDFGGRVTVVDSASVDDHATHVAGTMGGDGTLSQTEGGSALQWRGMAPGMDIFSYLWDNNIDDHNAAINTNGIEISQNSWGYDLLSPPASPEYYGYYGWDAPEYDGIVTGLYGTRISVVFAAGNDRDNVSGDYDTIGPPSTSKNMICVGAIHSDDDSMTVFSGWGPMDDGRIKPDVVAPGDEVGGDGGITSTFPSDTYGIFFGTSMAAPGVSGCASLIIEDYRSLYSGAYPLPSTVKALLIHGALDLGNTGPDYSFGYGNIQIQDSIDKLRTKSLVEDDVSHNASDFYTLYVPGGTTEVKITLVWDDEPAVEAAASTLVNDLELLVSDPNTNSHYPWTLNPSSPSDAAVQTQRDHTNNVEQVTVTGSIISGNWTIEVYGYNVPTAPQRYSLIFTPTYGDNVIGKIYKDSGYSQEDKFFDRTDTVYIEAYVVSSGSPVTGATVSADLELSDATPVTTVSLVDAGGGYYRNSWDSTGETPDVYLADINVVTPAINTQKYFHVYPQSGVSAYRLDQDEDGNDDYILENKHLISVYDGTTDTDKLLFYLEQKDTDVDYVLSEIADPDSKGTGEVTTTSMNGLEFASFLFSSEGENLTSAGINMDVNVNPPTTGLITFYDDTNGASYDGNFIIDAGEWIAERFNYNDLDQDYILERVSIYVRNVSGGTDPLVVEIRTDSGGLPTSTVLTSESIDKSSIPAGPAWYDVVFTTQITLSQGGWYWLVVRSDEPERGGPNNTRGYTWTLDSTSPTYAGVLSFSTDQGSSWSSASTYDAVFRAYGRSAAVNTVFDLSIQMKTQEVDYLVYKLTNFDVNIDDISDIFSPISGTLGSSVSDDRYHIGDATDGLVDSLSSGTWTDFSSLSDAQKYIAVYDDSNSSDTVNDNIISWVYFPNTNTLNFQDVGAWFETGKGGLRLRYDTTSGIPTDEAEYMLVFTQGDYSVIDQWMSTVAGGTIPSPNFMTAPSSLSISVVPTSWSIGQLTEEEFIQSTIFTVTNDGSITETFTLNIDGPSSPSGWLAGLSLGDETYVIRGLFGGTGDNPAGLFSSDDIILIGTPSAATSDQFGDPGLSQNGVSVGASGERGLWFEFQAPTSTSHGGEEQSITVTVGAETP